MQRCASTRNNRGQTSRRSEPQRVQYPHQPALLFQTVSGHPPIRPLLLLFDSLEIILPVVGVEMKIDGNGLGLLLVALPASILAQGISTGRRLSVVQARQANIVSISAIHSLCKWNHSGLTVLHRSTTGHICSEQLQPFAHGDRQPIDEH